MYYRGVCERGCQRMRLHSVAESSERIVLEPARNHCRQTTQRNITKVATCAVIAGTSFVCKCTLLHAGCNQRVPHHLNLV